jgi:hypothetical protein
MIEMGIRRCAALTGLPSLFEAEEAFAAPAVTLVIIR